MSSRWRTKRDIRCIVIIQQSTNRSQTITYRIFVAEVASTFNEQLLSKHLLENCRSKKQRQLLIAREIDNIRGTIYRQVMFAEFERENARHVRSGGTGLAGIAPGNLPSSADQILGTPT